mmetsp:Transcript_64652/g.192632  ORF Transcript_64652/g.192632 Transcript_64652/m.192632 type:complete len:251 (-) Transcript_64652:621-1373(-)
MPTRSRYSHAAPRPTACAIGGVPASKRAGTSAKVEPSRVTSLIISPPPFQGGICRRSSSRPQRKPTPVGPHILCPEAAIQSAPRSCTSTGRCGTDWHASRRTSAPARWAVAAILRTGFTQPRVFDTWAKVTSLVRGVIRDSMCSTSSSPLLATRAKANSAPVRWATNCHGTKFEWCSISVSTTRSPGPKFEMPQLPATKLMASVAPLVKTTSLADRAPMRRATLSRAASNASVARSAKAWAPRWTLAELS